MARRQRAATEGGELLGVQLDRQTGGLGGGEDPLHLRR